MAALHIADRRMTRMLRLLCVVIGVVAGATLIPPNYGLRGLSTVAAITGILSSMMQSLTGDQQRISTNLLHATMVLAGASFGVLLRMAIHVLAS